jgi:hypothetical protein
MGIFDGDHARLGRADFGDRGGDCALQWRAGGDRRLEIAPADRHEVDQFGVDEQRRARQHQRRDVGMIGCPRINHGIGRVRAPRQRFGERPAHQRRRVVEQHDHRALGGGAIVIRQVGVKIGPRQGTDRFGTLTGRGGARPMQELTDDHR